MLEGLAGASGEGAFDGARMSDVLAGLGSRVFLMHNVHEQAPVTFETRWTLSYLRGSVDAHAHQTAEGPGARRTRNAELSEARPTGAPQERPAGTAGRYQRSNRR